MNGSRIGTQKSRRRIKVAPVTRAVRIALAASAAAFALVGPGTALAQSCVDDAGTTRCDGTFVTPIEISNTVDDVTVVVGGLDPSTAVAPDPGYTAISVYSAGDVSLDNQASGVSSGYATAIMASAVGAVDVYSSGNVDAYAGVGIGAYSLDGDITVANSGSIDSSNYDDGYTSAGIIAYSQHGQVSTSNSGDIDSAGYGFASGIVSYSIDGNASATNTGDIDVDSYYGTATGVYAYSLNGDASVSNDGSVEASSGYGIADAMFASGAHVTASNGENGYAIAYGYTWAAGIEIHGNDSAQATNAGVAVGVSYYDGAHANGIYAAGGEGGVSVQNDGLSQGVSVGYGYGTGISAVATGGDIDIVNNGDAVGIAFGGYATGIQASGSYDGTDITIANDGNAYAYVRDDIGLATGIEATATGNVDITNTGAVKAYADAGFTTGIHAESTYPGGDAVVTNSGAIYAEGYYGGTGIEAMAVGAGGSASASNSEYIRATQGQVFGYGAYGMVASGDLDATVDNSGYIEAQSGGAAYGAVALATNGVAAASNSGEIDVYGMGYNYTGAYGLIASSANGTAEVDNSGTIEVASLYYGHGISASGTAGSTVTNSGDIVSDAWNSYGILATAGTGDAIVTNTVDGTVASIYTPAYYSATVLGIAGISTAGDVAIRNDGSVYAGAAGRAFGLAGLASAGNAGIVNTGTVEVDTYGNTAIGALVRAEYGTASFDNSGDIHVAADYSYAYGVQAIGASVQAVNTGSIDVDGHYAFGVFAVGTDVSVTNDGDIQVAADYDVAMGIYANGYVDASSPDGNVSVATGAGSHIAVDNTGSGFASGIQASSGAGDIAITSAGAIDVNANGLAWGIYAETGGDITIANTGDVTVESPGRALGILAYSSYGTITASNAGAVVAHSDGPAFGMWGWAYAGAVSLVNAEGGSIDVESTGSDPTAGIYAVGADVSATNDGDIQVVTGNRDAWGIYAHGYANASYDGNISVTTGAGSQIVAHSTGSSAYGIYAYSGVGDIAIASAGGIDVDGYYHGAGVRAMTDGDINISSTGDIVAAGPDGAAGIYGTSSGGTITASNGGSIAATADGGSTGILANTGAGAIALRNLEGGSIEVDSVYGVAEGMYARATEGSISVVNAGAIDAYSVYAPAVGVAATSALGALSLENSGSLNVSSGQIFGIGMMAQGDTAAVVSSGDISVEGYAGAEGVMAIGEHGAAFDNSGAIAVTSQNGFTVGAAVSSKYDGDVSVTNSGTIDALSMGGYATGLSVGQAGYYGDLYGDSTVTNSGAVSASAAYGVAIGMDVMGNSVALSNSGSATAANADGDAYGIDAFGDTVEIDNAGEAGAEATGTAVGIQAYGNESVAVTNSGAIHAVSGADGEAFGILVSGPGDASVTNSGSITASHPDSAVAVQFDSTGTATLANSGTIGVDSASEGAVIASIADGAGALEIANTGTMTGAIVTYAGDDSLANGQGGVWNVTNHATDFGAGDDAIRNAAGGTIALSNGAIYLGSSTEAGNSFVNEGLLSVSGENLIDMGTGVDIAPTGVISAMSFSPMAAPNPAAFMNDGIIDFVDGSPGDVLTIAGDFGGVGDINLDVNLVNGTSDLLYIDGDVIDGTQQTVNLAVDDIGSVTDPVPAQFMTVTGSVADGAFIPGEVIGFGADNFLDLKVNITQGTDGGANVFSIDTEVVGLNQVGVLAANVAPGAQTLIASAIGTMRQRAGAQVNAPDYGMGPWVRFFDNSGDVDPAHTQDFGTAGDFRFEQMNRGLEFGMGFDFDGPVGFGLLLGDADAKQQMKDGSGSDHIEMSSVGVYGTWTMPAFYVDLSFRWMDFDATLMSSAGESRGSGNATASNIEAGYTGWNMGGFDIVPQLQYTQSTVDVDALHGSVASFENGQNDSARGRLGVEISRSFDAAGFSWKPYAAASVVREFDGEGSYTIADTFSGTTSIEGTSTLLEAGIGTRIGGLSGTFGVNWSDGGALDSQLGGNLVLRYSW
jgi:hypothetical protein